MPAIKYNSLITVSQVKYNELLYGILVDRVFANGPRDLGLIPVESYQRL